MCIIPESCELRKIDFDAHNLRHKFLGYFKNIIVDECKAQLIYQVQNVRKCCKIFYVLRRIEYMFIKCKNLIPRTMETMVFENINVINK